MAGSIERAVVCSVREPDLGRTLEAVRRAPVRSALVEIRGDELDPAEVVEAVRGARRPVLVTLRGPGAGGGWSHGEPARRSALLAAVEAGASLIDVEWNGPLAELADGDLAQRVVLSHHGGDCRLERLETTYRAMAARRAARLKIVPDAATVGDLAAVRALLSRAAADGRALAAFALGRAGAASRLLALAWGSWATYGSLAPGAETAPGQLPADELLELYDVERIGRGTRLAALVGRHLSGSPSPAMHTAAARRLGLDARYLAIECDELAEVDSLLAPGAALAPCGLAVTMPFKETAAGRCTTLDAVARRAGAVNSVTIDERGCWHGANTDGPALLDLVRGALAPAGARVAVIGAGGLARAAAAVLVPAGARVTLYARDERRAAAAARATGAAAAAFEAVEDAAWDVLVQATPLGAGGERVVRAERLRGRLVIDAVYAPQPTPLLADARARGLAVRSGFELLVAQAALQFERLFGARPPADVLAAAGWAWLSRRARRSA